ncbi:ABC-type multidrug transport system ATPase subunit [Paenibacillus anaericanus]|uniref:ATP-binding cassette domain-containing protein n=1 Tax=Paenibacillus anaericanus TaxID=170367 RepID=UPI002783B6B3|nr:ATP-binding cassette domain-containing protein [Paenibacillus anaericanus]MDQ0091028.1 ABC-type multidrug transport system ATPase subunit [Paenibacillus anaericanus]
MRGAELKLTAVELHAENGHLLLGDVNLVLTPGWYGLEGANGSGKTALLKAIAGLYQPVRGLITYQLHGVALSGNAFKPYLGYKPQQAAYYDNMTVEAYLRYVGEMKLMPRTTIDERSRELCERLGLSNERKTPIQRLSGGNKQRLMIVQAMLADPWFLLLDEPLYGMDIEIRFLLLDALYEMTPGTVAIFSGALEGLQGGWLDAVIKLDNGTAALH